MSIQTRNVGFADLLLGALSTDAGMVVGYFFGTSMSSHEKTKLLAKRRNKRKRLKGIKHLLPEWASIP